LETKAFKIALVEDDDLIRSMIKINLEKSDYQVIGFPDGESLVKQAAYEPFDLFILDILLPGISGLKLLEELRKSAIHAHIPVLMLTVQSQVRNKIDALDKGADDYLVKPFNMDELVARVNALIRRSHSKPGIPASQILIINNYKIDLSTRICQSNKGEVVLSEKEIKLLKYFSRHPGQNLRRADILEEVWGMEVSPTPRTIDNFILKFRQLFETDPVNPGHFITIRNEGYRFESRT
jgi:two-component system alkaline phosphatase synthesis response regulator PhoP